MSGTPITVDEVRRLARLARVAVAEEELPALAEELGVLVSFFSSLADLELDPELEAGLRDAEPRLRPDEVRPGLSQDAALAQAPRTARGHFLVPKVIDR